jgi:uncharacterized LabA/DUF88 family protein
MNRVVFLVDGFNLYHSIRDIGHDFRDINVKWLNIYSLCRSYLYLFGKDALVHNVYYFSAYADHLNDPNIRKRHEAYKQCLESTSIIAIMGRFKPKEIRCSNCACLFTRYEEKETDVAIAIKLYELICADACDTVVLVTGDTDIIPAVKAAKAVAPSKTVIFAFPYRRENRELHQLAPGSFKIGMRNYLRHQFDDNVELNDGTIIHRPEEWR